MLDTYDFSDITKIDLFSGLFLVKGKSFEYTGNGSVSMKMKRECSVTLLVNIKIQPADWPLFEDYLSIKIYYNGTLLDFFVINCSMSPDCETVSIKAIAEQEPIKFMGDSNTLIDTCVSHFINLTHFCSHKLTLEAAPWKITFFPCLNGQGEQALLEDGGYALTHKAEIVSSATENFTGEELGKFIDFFRFFLFFVTGSWHVPVSPTGFRDNSQVWIQWGTPFSKLNPKHTWFARKHPEILTEIFPKYLACWNSGWEETLRETSNWYVIACDSSNDITTCIIVAQAALERLSYDYFVTHGSLSKTAYKKQYPNASNKITGLLSSLNIPTVIPTLTPALSSFADIGDAIAQVRNDIVHPKKNLSQNFDVIVQAWNLSLYSVELSMLSICGYKGKYGNRLDTHRYEHIVENVPWA